MIVTLQNVSVQMWEGAVSVESSIKHHKPKPKPNMGISPFRHWYFVI